WNPDRAHPRSGIDEVSHEPAGVGGELAHLPEVGADGSPYGDDGVRTGDQVGTAVERVHPRRLFEADGKEERVRWLGRRSDLSDQGAGLGREEGEVDLRLREELPDEVLRRTREAIGLEIVEARESVADGVPEIVPSIATARREELGQHFVPEIGAVRGHPCEARVGDLPAETRRMRA